MLKISTKFSVAPQSFCENQNSVQDQDQDHDITLDFNTRPYIEDTHQIFFGSANSFERYCVHMKRPRTYSQTTRQTDRWIFYLLVLSSKTRTFVKRREFFFTHSITILSLFTYSVCDEKVKKKTKDMRQVGVQKLSVPVFLQQLSNMVY